MVYALKQILSFEELQIAIEHSTAASPESGPAAGYLIDFYKKCWAHPPRMKELAMINRTLLDKCKSSFTKTLELHPQPPISSTGLGSCSSDTKYRIVAI